jgi:CRISPR-associated endonuclease/helicase Cas3
VYHSRYSLAVRSHIENKLDAILNRKDLASIWSTETGVGDILANQTSKNHIFVVLASPVAEVGRDHDYDWSIVEPSSMRSIIQLAGRVIRHRELTAPLKHPNILLLNQNIKALRGSRICFELPGFEMPNMVLAAHDLLKTLDAEQYNPINAIPRIREITSRACCISMAAVYRREKSKSMVGEHTLLVRRSATSATLSRCKK